jgi:hypothetical protein
MFSFRIVFMSNEKVGNIIGCYDHPKYSNFIMLLILWIFCFHKKMEMEALQYHNCHFTGIDETTENSRLREFSTFVYSKFFFSN